VAVEAMADKAHGFDVKEKIIAKISVSPKKRSYVELAQSSYFSNVLYSTSLHTRSYKG
jgi:hypothetical protein